MISLRACVEGQSETTAGADYIELRISTAEKPSLPSMNTFVERFDLRPAAASLKRLTQGLLGSTTAGRNYARVNEVRRSYNLKAFRQTRASDNGRIKRREFGRTWVATCQIRHYRLSSPLLSRTSSSHRGLFGRVIISLVTMNFEYRLCQSATESKAALTTTDYRLH